MEKGIVREKVEKGIVREKVEKGIVWRQTSRGSVQNGVIFLKTLRETKLLRGCLLVYWDMCCGLVCSWYVAGARCVAI